MAWALSINIQSRVASDPYGDGDGFRNGSLAASHMQPAGVAATFQVGSS